MEEGRHFPFSDIILKQTRRTRNVKVISTLNPQKENILKSFNQKKNKNRKLFSQKERNQTQLLGNWERRCPQCRSQKIQWRTLLRANKSKLNNVVTTEGQHTKLTLRFSYCQALLTHVTPTVWMWRTCPRVQIQESLVCNSQKWVCVFQGGPICHEVSRPSEGRVE